MMEFELLEMTPDILRKHFEKEIKEAVADVLRVIFIDHGRDLVIGGSAKLVMSNTSKGLVKEVISVLESNKWHCELKVDEPEQGSSLLIVCENPV